MRRTFTFLFLLLVSVGLTHAKTSLLKSYDQLLAALIKGERVRMVIHYGDCELVVDGETQSESPNAIGGMDIDAFEQFAANLFGNPQAFLSFSHMSLIHLGAEYVNNYVKIRVFEDNRVVIVAQYLKPESFEVTMNETFKGQINTGKNSGAIYFYKIR